MKIEIQYNELRDIVAKAAQKDLQLSYVSENTCSANVSLPSIPFLNRPMSATLDVTVVKVEGTALYLTLGGMPGIEMILPMAFGALQSKLPAELSNGFLEKAGGSSLILHLEKIEKFRHILEKITLQSITFTPEAVVLTVIPK